MILTTAQVWARIETGPIREAPDRCAWTGAPRSSRRYRSIHVRLDAIDADEMRDLVEDAWALCVPKYVAEEYAATRGYR
ncbi:MAG TPA: hypothetical protein VMT74_12860 [Gaiellaceae bacterium]|nr:hypothetical protein [Gaiellaceae bacterium]